MFDLLFKNHYDEHFIAYPIRPESIVQYSKSSTMYNLSKENQFFLFMIRLRRATEEHELVNEIILIYYYFYFYFIREYFLMFLRQLLVASSLHGLALYTQF